MSAKPFGMPGIGGGFGTCGLCGNPFLKEILLGEKVKSFTIDGCEDSFYGHNKCLEQFGNKQFDYTELPDGSPIKKAFVSHHATQKGETPND